MSRLSRQLRSGVFVCILVLSAGAILPAAAAAPGDADPVIAALLAQVQPDLLMDLVDQLSGEAPAVISGESYVITTRETESGEPIARATQFAQQTMAAHGLAVTYHEWRACGIQNRNVVAETRGQVRPDELVLVIAHLDSTSESAAAPGADDNASGAAAVMVIAQLLAPVSMERTLRFVLFTGEEQGLCGSGAYADAAAEDGENIVAVLNMDMIAWSTQSDPIARLHTRRSSAAGYTADLAIANTFIDVVRDYGLSDVLSPRIASDGEMESDHYSFWVNGYPGILAIEDDDNATGDFNPNYHTAGDRAALLNRAYYTGFVKAVLGTAAELAGIASAPAGPYKLNLPSIWRN